MITARSAAGREAVELMRRALPRIVAASAVMGAAVAGLMRLLGPALQSPGHRYGALAALVFGGMAVYGAAALAFGAVRVADLRGQLRRRR